jgi:hypothetical protein
VLIFVFLVFLALGVPAFADMYPDGSNAKLPKTGTSAGMVCYDTSGRLLAVPGCGGGIDPSQFGADPTGVGSSDAAVQQALDYAASHCQKLIVGPGVYRLTSPKTVTVPAACGGFSLEGASPGISKWFWTGASSNGLTINLTSVNQNATVKEMMFTTQKAGGGTGLELVNTSCSVSCSVAPTSLIDHVTMQGDDGASKTFYWTTAITITSASNVTISNSGIFSDGGATPHGDGVLLRASAAALGAGYLFFADNIESVSRGIVYGDLIQGVVVTGGTNIVYGNIGIDVPSVGQDGTLDQLIVTDSQINMITGIHIAWPVSSTIISNNLFIMGNGTAANAVGIDLVNPGGTVSVTGNSFQSGATGVIGIRAALGQGVIGHNTFQFVPTGIALTSTSTGWHVTNDNNFSSVTTPIANAGSNHVDGLTGWTPILVGATTPGAPTYTAQIGNIVRNGNQMTATFTLTGTALGGAAGNLSIGGLPLPVASGYGSCAIFGGGPSIAAGVGSSQYILLAGEIQPSAQLIDLWLGSSGGTLFRLSNLQMTPAFNLFGHCEYIAN